MSDYVVRLARPSDEDQLFELCRQLHEENGLCRMDDELVRNNLRTATRGEHGIIGVIEGENGKLEGVIL